MVVMVMNQVLRQAGVGQMRWIAITTLSAVACLSFTASSASAQDVPAFNASYGGEPYASQPYVTAPSSCGGDCGLICACEPETCYSIGANLLWLGRNKADTFPLIGSPANLAIPTFQHLNTDDMQFNVEAGIDVSLRGKSWELRYFGIYDQLARQRRTYDDGDAVTTNDMTIVHLGSLHGSYTDLTTVYSSDLHSGEVNYWLQERWGFEPVAGLRWMQQSEDLESFVTTDFGEGAIVAFSNDMYGGQLGVRRVLWETPSRFRVEATMKAGVLYNSTQLHGETRTGAVTTVTADRSDSNIAYVGEITVSAVYRFCPYFSARIGYNGLWMDRVGLAGDQINAAATAPGTTDLSTLIYQGGHVGIEYAW